jgi:lysophospholipase L1-like esterase
MVLKTFASLCKSSKLILFVLFCAFSWPTQFALLADEATAVAAKAKPTGPARFESEIAAFEKWDHQNAVPRDCILFVGSSTIRLWQTADAFPDLPVINRGFGGSTVADVNYFADRIVFKYKPRTIVFYSGDNDIAGGRTPDRVFDDFQTFAASVRERLPDTGLIYLAIKPSIARWKLWPKMQTVNARVKELANTNKQITYVDTSPPLLGGDGQPIKELFRDDGLHMSLKGYATWNGLLAPSLRPTER